MRRPPAAPLMVALLLIACGGRESAPAADTASPSAGPLPARIERATIHPDLPEYSFVLDGTDTGSALEVQEIEIRRGDAGGPVQVIAGLETETPLRAGEPVVEVIDMNFDGYGDFRLIEFVAAGPNVPYLNWLYDPDAALFVRAEALDAIPSPAYDPDEGRITSTWRDGATRYGIDTYQWLDERPVAIKKELREYSEPGLYERTVSELTDGEWTVVERETVRE